MWFIIFSIALLIPQASGAFFTGSISTGVLSGGVSCIEYVASTGVVLTVVDNYCVIEVTQVGSNLNVTFTDHSFFSVINFHTALMAQRGCSGPSASNMPLGIWSCPPRPYTQQTGATSQVCVCATNLCNLNLNLCQSSLALTNVSVPSLLANILPSLTTTVSCYDSRLPTYTNCFSYSVASGNANYFNMSACNDFYATNSVICFSCYDPVINTPLSYALSVYEADYLLDYFIVQPVYQNTTNNAGMQYCLYQSATSVLLALPFTFHNINHYYCFCFCTTSQCNLNITTCAAGFNFDCLSQVYNRPCTQGKKCLFRDIVTFV
jgi:hypothetical protein